MTIRVRELPPLRLHIDIATPSGRHYRWGDDEPDPANVHSGLRCSSTMPGGFESLDVTLPRKPGVNYIDLERLSTMQVLGAGCDVAGEYRLERTPRVSGDQMAVSPSAVGWQAHLEDDKSATELFIDREIGRLQGSSAQRLIDLGTAWAPITGPEVVPDASTGAPGIKLGKVGPTTGSTGGLAEAWYDAGVSNLVQRILFRADVLKNAAGAGQLTAAGAETDTATSTATFLAATAASVPYSIYTLTTAKRWILLQYFLADATDAERWRMVNDLAHVGDHGLSLHGDAGAEGVLASDVVAQVVARWAPLLTFRVGETLLPSAFPISHLVFRDATTAGEMVRQATRFGLQDWAVWDDKTFYWHERGARGRKWRARISPAQLEETGPQVDRVWESVIVQFQDVDGTTKTVGPPGSGADTETSSLKDSDPENPANKLGIIRRDLLQMGVSTIAGATELGRRFLEEQRLLDTSGRARLVGHVEDDRGILHPYWRVRAGDQISFIDAADPSYRRIVRADHSHPDRTCSVDLDAPPEGLQALLERLGVVLVPLGL